jgi:hypothetical protein
MNRVLILLLIFVCFATTVHAGKTVRDRSLSPVFFRTQYAPTVMMAWSDSLSSATSIDSVSQETTTDQIEARPEEPPSIGDMLPSMILGGAMVAAMLVGGKKMRDEGRVENDKEKQATGWTGVVAGGAITALFAGVSIKTLFFGSSDNPPTRQEKILAAIWGVAAVTGGTLFLVYW